MIVTILAAFPGKANISVNLGTPQFQKSIFVPVPIKEPLAFVSLL